MKPTTIMVNSYLKTRTTEELHQFIKDTELVCGGCPNWSIEGCSADVCSTGSCSILNLVKQAEQELKNREI